MIKDFILPDIGEGIVECELVEWLVSEGDRIEEDQPIADVMTDKALVQIPAPFAGRVSKLYYQQGESAKVHEPLFAVEVDEVDEVVGEINEAVVETRGALKAAADQAVNKGNMTVADSVFQGDDGGSVVRSEEIQAIPELTQRIDIDSDSTLVSGTDDLAVPENFILPDIGEGIVECEVIEWLVSEGERIAEDQPIADVMTDKALVQIPAPKSGVIAQLFYAQGESAQVHQPLYSFVPDAGQSPSANEASPVDTRNSPSGDTRFKGAPLKGAPLKEVPFAGNGTRSVSSKALASPAVRRIAREHNIDLCQVSGSGRDGRVLKVDMLEYVDHLKQSSAAGNLHVPEKVVARESANGLSMTSSNGLSEPSKEKVKARAHTSGSHTSGLKVRPHILEQRIEKIRGVKAVMARQMTLSASTIPHFTYGDEVDVTALLALRAQLKEKAEARGVRLTLMPFIMKALAMAIEQYPIINSRINDDVSEIHYQDSCNIGMAVDSKSGLLVPNIKGVENLSMLEIGAEVQRITEAARSGRVAQQDLQGGTVTVSNIGALGGTYAVPVINAPQVAIVALGKIQRIPRFDDQGEIVACSIMNVSWSGDHRIIDGGTIARFSGLWQSYLEDPSLMLLDLS